MENQQELQVRVEHIIVKIEEIIHSLRTAIEQGNDLHIGIVLGQSIKQLEEIAYG
jgi:hypothetical protein